MPGEASICSSTMPGLATNFRYGQPRTCRYLRPGYRAAEPESGTRPTNASATASAMITDVGPARRLRCGADRAQRTALIVTPKGQVLHQGQHQRSDGGAAVIEGNAIYVHRQGRRRRYRSGSALHGPRLTCMSIRCCGRLALYPSDWSARRRSGDEAMPAFARHVEFGDDQSTVHPVGAQSPTRLMKRSRES